MQNTTQDTTTHKAEIYVWAETDMHSNVTTLAHVVIDVADMEEARRKTRELLATLPGAHYANVHVATWWNQNVRSSWMHKRGAVDALALIEQGA